MIERTKLIKGCDDGPCPQIHETTEPQTIAVQGYLPTAQEQAAMGIPDGEMVVLVPRHIMNGWAQRP